MSRILTTSKVATISMKVGPRTRKFVAFKCEFDPNSPKKEISKRKNDVIEFLKKQKDRTATGKSFNLKHSFIEVNKDPLIFLLIVRLQRKPGDGGDVTPPTPPTGPVPKMK